MISINAWMYQQSVIYSSGFDLAVEFVTNYVPHTDEDRRTMLRTIGVSSMGALFDDIPEGMGFPELALPAPCSDWQLGEVLSSLATANSDIDVSQRFLGAGSYYHQIPALVEDVLRRSEFYTSYTPYQPELSQGLLQAIFEYQTMICRLTGMDISNASHYDGGTALAEAVLMALRIRNAPEAEVLMSPGVNPNMHAVTATYLQGTDATIISHGPTITSAEFIDSINTHTAAVVVQQPDFFGALQHLQNVADAAHRVNALHIVVVDPVSLGLFKPPADYNADIVVAEGQCLGMPPMFGGPGLGILATRKQYARQLAGRLVGETVDIRGARGYVLTLATREQHIRRAKATSNICTNAALSALAAAVYLASTGKQGLREIANVCYQRSHYAANALSALSGVSVNPWFKNQAFFREVVVALPNSVEDVNHRLQDEFDIIGGYDLGKDYPDLDGHMLLAFTEMNPKPAIDKLVSALSVITTS